MKKRWIALTIISIVIISVITSCYIMDSCSTPPSAPATTYDEVDTVRYEITGSAESVDVTLANDTGGVEQYSNEYLPRNFTYYDFQENHVYISAQNNGEFGTVTVTIYVNDRIFKSSSSSGAFVIATASGWK